MTQILIIGDTLAGWTTAAFLSHQLAQNNSAAICIIDSKQHSQLSLGNRAEVLTPESLDFHHILSINEQRLMANTTASFQLASHYLNSAKGGYDFMHSYSPVGVNFGNVAFHHHFARMDDKNPFEDYSLANQMARAGKFTHPSDNTQSILSTLSYGLHVDRNQYKNVFKQIALKNGVQGGVVDNYRVVMDGTKIDYIEAAHSEKLAADLFIDCTADGRIMNCLDAHGDQVNWLDWSNSYSANQVLRVTTQDNTLIRPVTQLQAVNAGLLRSMPLQNRTEHEFYFNSDVTNDNDAYKAFLALVDEKVINQPEVTSLPNKVRREFWVGNCLTLGRAAGIPQGATIGESYLLHSALKRLFNLLPSSSNTQPCIAEYNRLTAIEYQRVRDYQQLHLAMTKQAHSQFWAQQSSLSISPELVQKLALFRQAGKVSAQELDTVDPAMWVSLLIGLGLRQRNYSILANNSNKLDCLNKSQKILSIIEATLPKLPLHNRYLSQYCSSNAAN